MKKVLFSIFLLAIGLSAMAQQSIQLRSANRAECVSSDMTSLQASFSFSTIEAQDYQSDRGTFSWLSLPNTVLGGNEGEPQIPVVNELIAVPFGATPRIEVTGYSTTDYRLEDYGMKTLVPRQPSLRKDRRPEDVPFVYNAAAYQSTRGFRSEPSAVVTMEGTMRGVQLGKMTIEPVSYDPVNNIIRVFNNIDVTVHFDGADAQTTEDMLVKTYSPYFDIVYKQLFNERVIRSAYDDHPDLYKTPVKMLVVATSDYQSSTAFQNWLTWKKQKGIDVDIYTVTSSTASSTIRTQIQSRYNANHPTFLVIVGDETVVPAYKTNWSCGSTYGNCINDMEYASVDSDVYHDMFMSRMSVSSTTELSNLVNKILTYEKYTMSDPTYLNNSLLVAGWDSSWTNRVGKPTIQYANNNYYNSAHGINPTVYITTASGQTAAYNNINNVGFMNYTAHGDIQELADPEFTNSNVNSMSNNGKYLWVVANCCLTANWGNSSYKPCLGETMIRAANKGAFGYIGSIPESYWYEDYYFGVGAFSYVASTVQTTSSTTTGMYDAAFDDTGFNSLNSMPYIGNVAVTYAHAAGYTSSVTDEYYWRAYQCLGDGSVMPYLKNPAANNVSHASSIVAGTNSFTVNADGGSYVAITVNNEIIGVAAVPANATSVSVPFTTTPVAGTTAMIVVTRNQRQPYINTVQVINNNAPQYTITAHVTPSNSGTVEGAGTYYENTNCTLTAVANHGYAFQKWNDNNTDNPRTITVTGNATYTATFMALQQHHITYTAQQTHGTISVSPTNAYMGDVVTLTATPDAGYSLDHWTVTTGRENITVENNQFVMPDSEVTVSATFKSEPLTVADGTGTNSEIPFYGLYTDDNYQHTQTIYPASMLTNMQGCQITKLTYYLSSSVSQSYGSTFQVRLGTTTSTAFNSGTVNYISITDATTVYSGTLTVSGTTVEFDFENNPYLYTGGNLVIDVRITTLGDGYKSLSFYGESGSTYYSVKNRSTSSLPTASGTAVSFMPKTTFAFIVPTTDPYINLAPNSATILTGLTQALTATYGNVSGTPSITYTSSNNNVATVRGSGTTATVTAVAPGTATITATMTYEGTTYTATSAITVEDPSFCEPSFSSPSDDYISNFATSGGTTNISNSSTYVSGGFSDYYSTQSASIDAGGTLSCTVTASSTQWKYGHAIWVDWNKDYEFTSDERVAYTTSTASGNWTGTFLVPENTTAGDYRMRVIHLYNNTPTDACMSGSYGEAEDYKLTVLSSSNCPIPAITNVTATNNTATISTDSEASSFNVRYREYVETTPTTYTYDFEDGTQGWTTLKGNTGNSPNNWHHNTTHVSYNSTTQHDWSSFGNNSSSGFMISESYISATTSGGTAYGAVTPDNYLVSPQVPLGGTISFYAGARNSDYCAEVFSVMVSTTNNSSTSSFTEVATWTLSLSAAGYTSTPYTADLSAFAGQTGYIAIRHHDCYDQWVLCVDDITITPPTEGEAQWIELNGVSDLTITGLTPATTYEVQVQAICDGEEEPSGWSEISTFTTENGPVVETTELTFELSEGWNWWGSSIEISLVDLEAALGTYGLSIKAQNGDVASYSNNQWSGRLESIEVGKMYMIQVAQACTVTVTGVVVNPAEYPMTLANGFNWMGIIGTQAMSLDDAFEGFTPTNLDNIKTINGSAVYYQGKGWRGKVTTLNPGEGFIYTSKAQTSSTFTYPSAK